MVNIIKSFMLFAVTSTVLFATCPEIQNPSPYLQVGTDIRGLQDKVSWGTLKSRLKNNEGWQLNNGRKALDGSYGIKWEVNPSVKLVDGDGQEILGDYDKLWFKTIPQETDKTAYEVYKNVGPGKSLSTDGYHDGKLWYLYEGGISSTSVSVLKYLTQTKPSEMLTCKDHIKKAQIQVSKKCKKSADYYKCSLDKKCWEKNPDHDSPYEDSEAEIAFFICISETITKKLDKLGCEWTKDTLLPRE